MTERARCPARARALLPSLLSFFALAIGGAAAAPAAPGEDAAAGAAGRLAADVAWLAADEREGRRAGTEAALAAARWIAERLEALGLEPAGADGFLQPFEVPLPARDGGGSRVSLWRDGERAATFEGADSVRPLHFSEGGEVRGRLVFVGYGLIDEESGWDDYRGASLDGAVALVVRGAPPEPRSAVPLDEGAEPAEAAAPEPIDWAGRTSLFHKVMTAKRHGAVGVVIAQHPDGGLALPEFDASRTAEAGLPALIVSAEAADGLMPAYSQAVHTFDRIVGLVPASGASRLTAQAVGLELELEADVERARGPAANVLARLRGASSERLVVVGAHYDHLGHGGTGSLAPDAQGEVHNGADDNASGTAVVLEVARRLAAGEPPACDVLLALWSGEELGLLGSEHWARDEQGPLGRVVANVNLDMVGRAGDGSLIVLGAGSSPVFAGWLAEAGPAAGLELDVELSGQGVGGSDHQVFLRREIPALHLFSGVHADYHKPSDDAERFEAEGAARVAALTEDLVRRLGAADALPFTAPEVDPSRPRRDAGWSVWFGTVPDYAAEGGGLHLAGTSPGSPAEKAGLLEGDVIVEVGGVAIETIHDFVYVLQIHKPGDVVLARFQRDGEPREVRITLEPRRPE